MFGLKDHCFFVGNLCYQIVWDHNPAVQPANQMEMLSAVMIDLKTSEGKVKHPAELFAAVEGHTHISLAMYST